MPAFRKIIYDIEKKKSPSFFFSFFDFLIFLLKFGDGYKI